MGELNKQIKANGKGQREAGTQRRPILDRNSRFTNAQRSYNLGRVNQDGYVAYGFPRDGNFPWREDGLDRNPVVRESQVQAAERRRLGFPNRSRGMTGRQAEALERRSLMNQNPGLRRQDEDRRQRNDEQVHYIAPIRHGYEEPLLRDQILHPRHPRRGRSRDQRHGRGGSADQLPHGYISRELNLYPDSEYADECSNPDHPVVDYPVLHYECPVLVRVAEFQDLPPAPGTHNIREHSYERNRSPFNHPRGRPNYRSPTGEYGRRARDRYPESHLASRQDYGSSDDSGSRRRYRQGRDRFDIASSSFSSNSSSDSDHRGVRMNNRTLSNFSSDRATSDT